jgi:spore maturation protein SpmA
MKVKSIYIVLMVIVAIVLFWEQTKVKHNIYIQIIGIVCFFYGMMKLSAKVPSKNQDKEE